MEGISLVETKVLQALIDKVDAIQGYVEKVTSKDNPYMTIEETAQTMGFTKVWVINNKHDIGFSSIGRSIRFKRKDVEAYMEQNYFKSKSPRRK
jgi:excisionase family DNA binding protein